MTFRPAVQGPAARGSLRRNAVGSRTQRIERLAVVDLMPDEAVRLLRRRGFDARKISDGVTEWRASGQPLEH